MPSGVRTLVRRASNNCSPTFESTTSLRVSESRVKSAFELCWARADSRWDLKRSFQQRKVPFSMLKRLCLLNLTSKLRSIFDISKIQVSIRSNFQQSESEKKRTAYERTVYALHRQTEKIFLLYIMIYNKILNRVRTLQAYSVRSYVRSLYIEKVNCLFIDWEFN